MKAENKVVRILDGFRDSMQNLMSGLGGPKDKAAQAKFTLAVMSQIELEFAYRGDWMARKIIDIPANDATREWRAWQAEGDDIELLEEAERELGVAHKVRHALKMARLYGGSIIVLGIRNGIPTEPLDIEKIKQGDLQYIHVASKYEVTPAEIDLNVLSPTYGEPLYYEVQSPDGTLPVRIHPSRVLRFVGKPMPSLRMLGDNQWGDSILQAAYDAVVGASQSLSAIAALIQEAKVDVVKVPNLMLNIGGADYRSRLIERFTLANTGKSIVNTLILDKEEEWDRMEQTFGGLPDLMTLFLLVVSGAADIPVTRMLGQSPAGLNATGESDLRNYYDHVGSEQKNVIEPILSRLDEVLIRHALGNRPDEIYYEWNPLWQMGEAEKAAVAKTKAETFQIDMNAGLIDPMALKKARINQLVEDGFYPGLETAIDDVEKEGIDEDDPDVQTQFQSGKVAATGGVEVPQDTALNGAQITSLLGIVTATANKSLPPETAIQLIMVGFPLIKQETARAIISPLAAFEAAPPSQPFGAPASEEGDEEDEDEPDDEGSDNEEPIPPDDEEQPA